MWKPSKIVCTRPKPSSELSFRTSISTTPNSICMRRNKCWQHPKRTSNNRCSHRHSCNPNSLPQSHPDHLFHRNRRRPKKTQMTQCWRPWLIVRAFWILMTRAIGIITGILRASSSYSDCESNSGRPISNHLQWDRGRCRPCWTVPDQWAIRRKNPRYLLRMISHRGTSRDGCVIMPLKMAAL